MRWALVPLLAILAYGSVLRIGFLSDDFVALTAGRTKGLSLSALLPDPNWLFYRPLGTVLTWGLGWRLWGYNPFPYHLLSLLLHAGVALALGLWLKEVSRRPSLGWLAGALFAVFPLHTEAVGWLASQWDLWAAMFGLLSLWLFTRWWLESDRRHVYFLAVVCFGLGVFSKESLVTFLPLFVLSAWMISPRPTRRDWWRLVLTLVPFMLLLVINLALRIVTWGSLGGYPGAEENNQFFWDHSLKYAHVLIAPLNPLVFGNLPVQVIGALISILLLVGLIWYGRRVWRLLFVAGAWIGLTTAPVLNLPVSNTDLQNNRFLYLAAAGYCVAVAVLLHSALNALEHRRGLAIISISGLLILSGGACWMQLGPWHTATAIGNATVQQLHRLIPPTPNKDGMIWYVENLPDSYKGAYIFRLGFDLARYYNDGDLPHVEPVSAAARSSLTTTQLNSFALRFSGRFSIDYIAGVTTSLPPPAKDTVQDNLLLWDLRDCNPAAVSDWKIREARAACEPGQGLAILASRGDPQLVGPALAPPVDARAAQFVRLRVAVRYPGQNREPGHRLQWFWPAPGANWTDARSTSLPIKPDGLTHVYWTFLPTTSLDAALSRLRFDPVDDTGPATVEWIAVDWVR